MESQFTSREAKLRAAVAILKLGARAGLQPPPRDEGEGSPGAVVLDLGSGRDNRVDADVEVDSRINTDIDSAASGRTDNAVDSRQQGAAAAAVETDFNYLAQGGHHEQEATKETGR